MDILHEVNLMWSVWSLAYRGSTNDKSDKWKCVAVDNKGFLNSDFK
jgi:hypothetical protein